MVRSVCIFLCRKLTAMVRSIWFPFILMIISLCDAGCRKESIADIFPLYLACFSEIIPIFATHCGLFVLAK